MKSRYLWKIFRAGLKSKNGDAKWKIGKWYKHTGKVEIGKPGFLASPRIIEAMRCTSTEIIARVEVKGKSQEQIDMEVWSEMKIIEIWNWEKRDSVELAVFAAEKAVELFEVKCPDDKNPRKAIKAAKVWLKNPNKKSANAAFDTACAAGTSYVTDAVAHAACTAVYAACAACAAVHATYAAIHAVHAAARAADAAHAASGNKILEECEEFIQQKLKNRNE